MIHRLVSLRRLALICMTLLCAASIGILGLARPVDSTAAKPGGDENEKTAASPWTPMPVPGVWEEVSGGRLANYDGYAWYRCAVKVPGPWKDSALTLRVEKVDNAHEAYFNGRRIGAAGAMPPAYRSGLAEEREYKIDAKDVRAGRINTVAIRVYDNDGRGGFKGRAPQLLAAKKAIDLTGDWEFRPGDDAAWAAEAVRLDVRFERVVDVDALEDIQQTRPGGLSPHDALAKLKVPDDLEIDQVLADPIIAQPLFLNFDERGRMWVVEYRQYPHPAGLKIVSRDNYWRNVYDKVPPAPPHHFAGKDKITIHEDTDGDGRYDRHKTFVDGLNIATAVERGRGGVWVLNPPYLLFYADANNDDVPDGDPVVHLAGFGMEDTHSVVNSLRWGPDGWLYAAQGSTVSAKIRRPGVDKPDAAPVHSMGQLIWRYHPLARTYEIFAEGGGNAFGVEIDSKGRVFSGHNGGDTRGFHYVQGGYLRKGFTKHGPLSNPYAFGFFHSMKHHSVPRFTHTFLIYDSGALPASYQGRLFGVEPLHSRVVFSEVTPDGASFRTRDLGFPITSGDKWFRPVDVKSGPDGAIYVADWYDGQVSHLMNHQGQIDPTDGRVYRLRAKGAKPAAPPDLGSMTTAALVEELGAQNRWRRQTALRLLADRRDRSAIAQLAKNLEGGPGQLALESLWALNLCGGFDDQVAMRTLGHPDPYVRLWTARLLCDGRSVSPVIARRLAELARTEPNVEVRSQLASSARRLPATDGLPIVAALLAHDEDRDDVYMPLLLWWALETHCTADPAPVLAMMKPPEIWKQRVVADHILSRLMRRFAATGARADLMHCAALLESAPDAAAAKQLMAGFEEAYKGRSLAGLPERLARAMTRSGVASLALRIRQGEAAAIDEALRGIAEDRGGQKEQIESIRVLGEVKAARALGVLLASFGRTSDTSMQTALLASLQNYGDPAIAPVVLKRYATLNPEVRETANSVLASRKEWARALLAAVDSGSIRPDQISLAAVRKIRGHDDAGANRLVKKHWGNLKGETTAQIAQRIEQLTRIIDAENGSPYRGKEIYKQSCAKCHTLFDEGGKVGPDLTAHKRDDLAAMLRAVMNPSAEIREGYENHMVLTDDGRRVDGLLVDQDKQVVVLRGPDGQNVVVRREEIDTMQAVGQSLMPEGLLGEFTDRQIRDLFAYLRSTQPLNN